jgi:hypothetical protein
VEEYDARSVIPPDARAHLDDYGNIVSEVAPWSVGNMSTLRQRWPPS